MTKSELIKRMAHKQFQLADRDVELAVKMMLGDMAADLAGGRRNPDPRLRELLAAIPPGAGRAQPKDRDAGLASREVCPVLQAGQEAARARRPSGWRLKACAKRCAIA